MTIFLCLICFFFIAYSLAEAFCGADSPVNKALGEMLTGAVSLFAAHLLSPLTGVPVTISILSLGASIIGGIPGTALIMLLNSFFV